MANDGITKKVVFDLNRAISSAQSLATKAASGRQIGMQEYSAMVAVISSLAKGVQRLAEHVESLEKRLPKQEA